MHARTFPARGSTTRESVLRFPRGRATPHVVGGRGTSPTVACEPPGRLLPAPGALPCGTAGFATWRTPAGGRGSSGPGAGDPWRVRFASDPRRNAILLVGGNEAGDERWYKVDIPIAEGRFARHRADSQDTHETGPSDGSQ